MKHNISYKGRNDPQRSSTLDLVKWFGFKTSLVLAREARRKMDYKTWSFLVAFGGVSGFPVWNAYERWSRTVLPTEGENT